MRDWFNAKLWAIAESQLTTESLNPVSSNNGGFAIPRASVRDGNVSF